MNVALDRRWLAPNDVAGGNATLFGYALFHLNLAFSSIEEEKRVEVIERCYWPLLRLADKHGPIGIEATGFTLEEIEKRDPSFIVEAKRLLDKGRIELIGSGYSQMIGPLVPARVTEKNLKIGNTIYSRMFGIRPRIALVNEQAYSAGLVGLYLDAGYEALAMDWDNCGAQHPEWDRETRYRPQNAVGADGRSIGVIWTNTVAFQKLQRLAHGDIGLADYVDFVRGQKSRNLRALCLYASDGEIFDFRPGRFRTEEQLGGGSEWAKLEQAFATLAKEEGFRLIAPSSVLELTNPTAKPLRLESAACPIPVKKQRKYNLARWAVTGRDDLAVNAACERIYQMLSAHGGSADDWKELCYLWASDFRTHITEKRWQGFRERLNAFETRLCSNMDSSASRVDTLSLSTPSQLMLLAGDDGEVVTDRFIAVETPSLFAKLDRRRGLAIADMRFAGNPQAVIGGLPHGTFDDIGLQADWYTGDCVFEAPGEHKITDLEWAETRMVHEANGDVIVQGQIETPKGAIIKTMRFHAETPRVDFDIAFDWSDWGKGSLRLGHITLLPEAFDWSKLSLTTHNGGKESETFALDGQSVDHGAPVSFLVSSSYGLGLTEGWAEIGDTRTRIRIEVDRKTAPLMGLLSHRQAGGSLFCQLVLSALELDDTRKPDTAQSGLRRVRFSVTES